MPTTSIDGIPRPKGFEAQGEIRHTRPRLGETAAANPYADPIVNEHLAALEFDYEDLQRKAQADHLGVSEYRAALGEAEGRLARLFSAGVDHEEYKKAASGDVRKAINAAEDEVYRARTAHDNALARSKATTKAMAIAREVFTAAQRQYAAGPRTAVEPTPLPKGVTADEFIDRVDDEVRRVKAAAIPQQEFENSLIAQVDALAGEAEVRISGGKNPRIGFPVVRVNAEPSGEEIPHTYDIRPWLARHFRDDLVDSIKAQVAERYRDVELTLSEAEKSKRLKELAADRLNADRHRCATVWARHAANPTAANLGFPKDADPRAVLGCGGKSLRSLRDDED
jgi:hypothetical protein